MHKVTISPVTWPITQLARNIAVVRNALAATFHAHGRAATSATFPHFGKNGIWTQQQRQSGAVDWAHNDLGVEGGESAGNQITIILHALACAELSDCRDELVMRAFVRRWLENLARS